MVQYGGFGESLPGSVEILVSVYILAVPSGRVQT